MSGKLPPLCPGRYDWLTVLGIDAVGYTNKMTIEFIKTLQLPREEGAEKYQGVTLKCNELITTSLLQGINHSLHIGA